jgi:hypothetical protein
MISWAHDVATWSEPDSATVSARPDPVRYPSDDPDLRRTLETACAKRSLDASGARLVYRYSNAIYLLPHESAIAKITKSQSLDRVRTTQYVAEWLAVDHVVAATRPLPGADPVSVDSLVVGFWVHYPQPADITPASEHLARTLAALHQVGKPPIPVKSWTPLASLSAALADPATAVTLSDSDRTWLLGYVDEVKTRVLALDWALGTGVIHGDAWSGNVLWDRESGPDAVVLADWDNVCIGPREVDLIPTWHAAVRYGRGPVWTRSFASNYGYDLSTWSGFETLLDLRDLVQLTGPLRRAAAEPALTAALRQRFDAIRSGDRVGTWRAF